MNSNFEKKGERRRESNPCLRVNNENPSQSAQKGKWNQGSVLPLDDAVQNKLWMERRSNLADKGRLRIVSNWELITVSFGPRAGIILLSCWFNLAVESN
ncbi:hypothetical protein IAD21_03374 [Abditibacteriota bacterium]|nr:hypothetical protein IAD21_03374 [Abditibacteriota bacterium]